MNEIILLSTRMNENMLFLVCLFRCSCNPRLQLELGRRDQSMWFRLSSHRSPA